MDVAARRSFAANAVRLQFRALAYDLGNFMRTLAIPEAAEPWSLTSVCEKLVKIGAKVVSRRRYVVFQIAEVSVRRCMVADILLNTRVYCRPFAGAALAGVRDSGMSCGRTRGDPRLDDGKAVLRRSDDP